MFNAADAFKPDFYTLPPQQLKAYISPHYQVEESQYLSQLIEIAQPSTEQLQRTTEQAQQLIEQVRAQDDAIHMVDALLLEYSLDTKEGILLMCLAEALMRIPDADTADALIKDKLSVADWQRHLKKSDSVLVNASTWGLLLTGKVTAMDSNEDGSPSGIINRLVNRLGEPVIRKVMNQAMKVMGKQFVLGRSIQEALKNSRKNRDLGYTYSYDMLGEAALTKSDADKYFNDYLAAINAVGAETYGNDKTPPPTISIKLSALHPRYEKSHEQRVMTELFNTVIELIKVARQKSVGITIDAEEADRLEISLQLFEKLYRDPVTQGWGQFGLVVQAYSKRTLPVLCWLNGLAAQQGDVIPIRLVKGAYWDSEIKHCQQLGTEGYPVFTRKEATDVSYLACAQFLLSEATKGKIYPQFASHNAHTVASILAMANGREYEFQRLHGMGDGLYKAVLDSHQVPVRIYAPVGAHKDLLPYLVRRLLENGANSSFVHRLVDAKTPVDELTKHPLESLKAYACLANERIPTPPRIYGNERRNSKGINILIESQWQPLAEQIRSYMNRSWQAGPIINGEIVTTTNSKAVSCPYRTSESVGEVCWATEQEVKQALAIAKEAFPTWNNQPVTKRAQCLQQLADLLEANLAELIALCHREAGKTIQDSIDEVREAVDFCRYYAVQAEQRFGHPQVLPGPTGESNELSLMGRGVFVCISPWNFPLAIFLGQIAAALAAGNTVIAKPAEQTSLIAFKAVQLMLEAGFPAGVIQLLPGDGAQVGAPLTAAETIAGVAFTGSTDTAQLINRTLAARQGAIVPLIAETGGQNAMIVDSTALPEQVVSDVVHSAFASAGQRCSALRVLFVQEDVSDRILDLLKGAMAELDVGDPSLLSTDLGPVIDQQAQQQLLQHISQMKQQAKLIAETSLPDMNGYFVPPTAIEIESINQLIKENFGPILHVVRYKASQLDQVVNSINETGFGLTLGVHSRNEALTHYIADKVNVGNVYVNRNQIGAVVGVQPFGGQGLSGTGPKAGGPHYLYRFATEKVRTINTTAVGGNASLLSLASETV
ncbi:bifunctional proline dehydrogenase/L-glutamate gamma-semialdehyde dehydrogenase PutA [Spartinivicinus poritis]|uniref:Bifunctional protein PutA n=1 Tax=Spartinivicinus poritis TaxID=2994640 RepID=A0ABT5U964_9GAMM|nr:bifunctional proline dehydrogenase/L-glutamate gamma-semialdehyde dehydrogenase PutA [Spartinivicinus sp. A2-2]MDE1462918.1 bifunctional proline dehydrogenase/L-glutamate gamma-semialdehyde dehydrogenase PutA [Spartinivicinus sp. A2-2]